MRVEDYKRWLQAEVLPEDREERDLQKYFRDAFPLRSDDGLSSLEFVGYSVKGSLAATLRLVVWERTADGNLSIRDVKEQELYLAALPELPAFRDWDMPSDTETRILGDVRKVVERARKRMATIGDKVDVLMPHDFFSTRMPR